jgi:3'(2'), 5'-bisphosphate nucleotidase
MEKELEAARQLAAGAGDILMEYYRRSVSIDWKAPGDPVTAADREASEFIVGNLRHEFPTHAVLSEEEPDDPARLERSHVWMVDPMDGTREFIANRDEFAVMIGLIVHGLPVVGAVYQPTSKKMYYAAAGMGAFMEFDGATVPLRVSPESVASGLTIAVSRSHRSSRVDAIQDQMRIPESIPMGSVGLKVGLICEARAHLYVHVGQQTHLWDTCGPDAILREAGGRLTDVSNEPLRYTGQEVRNMRGILASNAVIHDRAVRVTQAVVASTPIR